MSHLRASPLKKNQDQRLFIPFPFHDFFGKTTDVTNVTRGLCGAQGKRDGFPGACHGEVWKIQAGRLERERTAEKTAAANVLAVWLAGLWWLAVKQLFLDGSVLEGFWMFYCRNIRRKLRVAGFRSRHYLPRSSYLTVEATC